MTECQREQEMGKFYRHALIFFASVSMLLPGESPKKPSVEIELGQNFGEFTIVNPGDAIALSSSVIVERKLKGHWSRTPVTNLLLREECTQGKPNCQKLLAKTKLRPLRWTGSFCSSQCPSSCRLDGPAPAGTGSF